MDPVRVPADAPKFSVLTVVRNDLGGLRRTFDSTQRQTMTDYQHVIVDGASTDGTAGFVDTVSDPRVTFISEPDNGIYDAMNKAMSLATGHLIVYMNAGDTFGSPSTLETVWSNYSKFGWKLAYGQERILRDGEPIRVGSHAPFDLASFRAGRKWLPHQATYLERTFGEVVGPFRLDIGTAADQAWLMRAALLSEPHIIFEFLANFELGGVHSRETPLARERMWHQIRLANGCPMGGREWTDSAYALLSAGITYAGMGAGRVRRRWSAARRARG